MYFECDFTIDIWSCEELGQFVFRTGSNTEDVICGLRPDPHPAGSANTTRLPNPTNDTGRL